MARLIVMPSFGMYTAEGSLTQWLSPAGANVKAGEPIAEISTEKASHELVAPADGILHPVAVVGESLSVEAVLGYILNKGEEPPTAISSGSRSTAGQQIPSTLAHSARINDVSEIRATPVARRLAREHQIDLASVGGTGPGGRIVEADVLSAIQYGPSSAGSAAEFHLPRLLKRCPLTPMRRTISDRLKKSLSTTVPLTLTREVRVDVLVQAKSALAAAAGKNLSFDALFIKLLGLALRQRPELNATIEDDSLLFWDDINIGFAVAVPGGLQVPVVRNADAKTLKTISETVTELSRRAIEGTLGPGEVLGGTATITNLGAFGVDAFTPILNPPQSAILGIGRIIDRPVVENGTIVLGKTCILSVTFDHRVVDGVPAAQLLDSLAARMTDKESLLSLSAVD